jgi:hypothetical protein
MRTPPVVRGLLRSALSRVPRLERLARRAAKVALQEMPFEDLAAAAAAQAPDRIAVFEYPYRQEPAALFASVDALLHAADGRIVETFSKLGLLRDWIATIPLADPPDATTPTWENAWLPPIDALSLALLLVEHRPSVYLEIGSGTSTKFARSAIRHFALPTRIVSIDPHPRAEIDDVCDEVVRKPLEDVGPDRFAALGPGDLLFFDGSHRSFPGSDVTTFFLDIVPLLRSGVVWGIHDICLPFDYPREWCRDQRRYYNEQYLLAAYLLGGGGRDAVLMPNAYACWTARVREAIPDVLGGTRVGDALARGGGCFWLRRSAAVAARSP